MLPRGRLDDTSSTQANGGRRRGEQLGDRAVALGWVGAVQGEDPVEVINFVFQEGRFEVRGVELSLVRQTSKPATVTANGGGPNQHRVEAQPALVEPGLLSRARHNPGVDNHIDLPLGVRAEREHAPQRPDPRWPPDQHRRRLQGDGLWSYNRPAPRTRGCCRQAGRTASH
jgi:hypothetical protein